ncbi:MAG TPA: hypothetical protein VKD28_16795 [Gemmatimonadales bacterium]|nr:hypothetical protein [Gemmatimonadales bacterium]
MNSTLLIHRLRTALAAGALVALAGCDRWDAPAAGSSSAPLRIGLEVSSLDAAPGARIAVAIRADLDAPDRLGGLQGTLRFDPSRLRYVGQDAASPSFAILNDSRAGEGMLRVLSMDVSGLAPRTVILAFDVASPSYASGLRYLLDAAATTDVRPLTAVLIAERAELASDLALVGDAARLTLADWDARLSKGLAVQDGPRPTPGQYLLNLRYGDANLSNSLNVLDASYIANVAVGNQEIIIGSDAPSRDAVVAGNVFPTNNPGLGEPSDANPPGREANGSRIINVFDALAIANEAVGNPRDIVGELVPGRGPLATNRVNIPAGTITTDQTWTSDNIYQLDGMVRVDGGATLTIQAGTRIEGNSAVNPSALVIQRNGRILAQGTALQPINMTCTAQPAFKGCWGGLWIAGNAPINASHFSTTTSPVIPGRAATGGCFEAISEGGAGHAYGGCNPDDSSGVVQYVVVSYGGFLFSPNNELNNISLGGVGRKTVFDHVQAHAGLDDGVELFGGTLDPQFVLLTANSDDSWDICCGWNGSAQFVLVQHDSLDSDKGIEADNTEPPASIFLSTPRMVALMYNYTFVGKKNPLSTSGTANNNSMDAIMLRRGAHAEISNVLVLSHRTGMDMDDDATCDSGPYRPVHNSIFAGIPPTDSLSDAKRGYGLGNPDAADPAGCPNSPDARFAEDSALLNAASNNVVVPDTAVSNHLLRAAFDVRLPDFRPLAGSLAATTVGATPPATHPVTGQPTKFDLSATYIGAVAPANASGSNIPWYAGWTRGWQSASAP